MLHSSSVIKALKFLTGIHQNTVSYYIIKSGGREDVFGIFLAGNYSRKKLNQIHTHPTVSKINGKIAILA
jgi:hypothetical protein